MRSCRDGRTVAGGRGGGKSGGLGGLPYAEGKGGGLGGPAYAEGKSGGLGGPPYADGKSGGLGGPPYADGKGGGLGGPPYADGGMAMFFVIGLLAVLMIGSATFFSLLNRTMSRAHTGERHQVCLNLAEGGVDKALAELCARPSIYTGEKDTALGEGTFTVEVERGTAPGAYHVVSTGLLRDGKYTLAQARIAADAVVSGGRVTSLRWMEERSWR